MKMRPISDAGIDGIYDVDGTAGANNDNNCDSNAFDHLQRLPGGVHVDGSEVLGQGEVAELTLDVIVRLHS